MKKLLYKYVFKVDTFNNSLKEYPILIEKIIKCSIEANKFVNHELFADCVEFKTILGLNGDDFVYDRFTLVIYSYHSNPK